MASVALAAEPPTPRKPVIAFLRSPPPVPAAAATIAPSPKTDSRPAAARNTQRRQHTQQRPLGVSPTPQPAARPSESQIDALGRLVKPAETTSADSTEASPASADPSKTVQPAVKFVASQPPLPTRPLPKWSSPEMSLPKATPATASANVETSPASADPPKTDQPAVKFVASQPPLPTLPLPKLSLPEMSLPKATPATASADRADKPLEAALVNVADDRPASPKPQPAAPKPPTLQPTAIVRPAPEMTHPPSRLAPRSSPPTSLATSRPSSDLSAQVRAVTQLVQYENATKVNDQASLAAQASVVEFVQQPMDAEVVDDQASQTLAVIDDDFKPIGALTTSIRSTPGELPTNHAAAKFAMAGNVRHVMGTNRHWQSYELSWEAPSLCHQPLYFEDANLERLGYSYGVAQPLISAAHFFARIPALPYLQTLERPRDCIFTLGHYRPGSYAPYQMQRIPLRLDASAVEGGVVAGLIFLIP